MANAQRGWAITQSEFCGIAYGLLLAAAGGGALVGAFGLAAIRQLKRQGRIMIGSGLVFAASIIGFAISPSLPIAMALSFIAGIATTIFGTLIATFIQTATPNELRGRVSSLYTITMIGLPSLGAMSTGAIAEMLGGIAGAPKAVLIGSALMAGVVILVAPIFWQRSIITRIHNE